jgi:hypothetical protein
MQNQRHYLDSFGMAVAADWQPQPVDGGFQLSKLAATAGIRFPATSGTLQVKTVKTRQEAGKHGLG